MQRIVIRLLVSVALITASAVVIPGALIRDHSGADQVAAATPDTTSPRVMVTATRTSQVSPQPSARRAPTSSAPTSEPSHERSAVPAASSDGAGRPTPTPARLESHSAPLEAGYGCTAALAYLTDHAAPGFQFECPGWAYGHQAMTCVDLAGVCTDSEIIVIADPCPAAYMNEASNSWVLTGRSNAPIDPYGYCSGT